MTWALRMGIFLSVFAVLIFGTHTYVYRRLFRDTAPSDQWRRRGAWALVMLGVGLLGGTIGARFLSPAFAVPLAFGAFLWMGAVALLVLALIALDLTRVPARLTGWVQRRRARGAPIDVGRRQFIARGSAAVATVGSLSVAAAGVHTALDDPELREVDVVLPRLPPAFEGLRIVQLSDIHVGPTIGRDFVRRVVDRVNALSPDLVAITGDLVDGSVADLGPAVAPLGELKSRFGTFFVTGNHEYYSGADAWIAELRRLGVNVLRNETVSLERDGQHLDLVGVDDWRSRGFGGDHGYAFDRAIAGRDPNRAAVMLAHQPKVIDDAAGAGLDLVLCGHTHGGQIWPFTYFVCLIQPYVKGLHHHAGRTWIFVHAGTGYWGPPVRVNVPSEIAVITLTRGPAEA